MLRQSVHAALASALLLSPTLLAQRSRGTDRPARPLTVAESSAFVNTGTLDEVRAFLESVKALAPAGSIEIDTMGKSEKGRDLLVVRVPCTAPPVDGGEPPLRVLIVANIHAGEVCGKEAVQMILREIALGEHADLTARCELRFVPVYNADGNDAMDPGNRRNQNGPVGGMGERENTNGLDLNRDCIKAESAEFRALLGVMRSFDPQVLFDLHTTNGSPHAYNITYATSLCTNVDAQITAYARNELIPAVRSSLRESHGVRAFDYGNFGRGEPPEWSTFDHRPRFLTNYFGLRNGISMLSEAYAYDPFEDRVRNTRAFVLELLHRLADDRAKVRALCDAADRRCVDGDASVTFGTDTILAAGEEMDVLVGQWDEVPLAAGGSRLTRRTEFRPRRMNVRTSFTSRVARPLPAGGWALVEADEAVLANLAQHGIEIRELATPFEAQLQRFVPSSGDRETRPYQGHRAIRLRGSWVVENQTLPAGTRVVPSHQPLARLAAQLLEPESEDGLTTWEFFFATTTIEGEEAFGEHPVARLGTLQGAALR